MERYLMTGATGFVGQELLKRLIAIGADVTVLGRHSSDMPGVRYLKADITDADALAGVTAGLEFDYILHIASLPGDTGIPVEMMNVNVTGALNMLECENLDIVDIATPVSTHRTLISYCCSRVANILCEKPFVDHLEDGEFLVRECKRYGCRTMVCQSYRWHPWYEQIKTELKNDVIGTPCYVNIMQRISFDIPYGKECRFQLYCPERISVRFS